MEKEFIPYQQALALKELRFDESCLGFYEFGSMDEEWHLRTKYVSKNEYNDVIHILKAPLYQQAFRWFREKYKLHNGIYPYYEEYEFQIKDFRLPTNTPINGGLMPYEEAELECLNKLIEIVKNK